MAPYFKIALMPRFSGFFLNLISECNEFAILTLVEHFLLFMGLRRQTTIHGNPRSSQRLVLIPSIARLISIPIVDLFFPLLTNIEWFTIIFPESYIQANIISFAPGASVQHLTFVIDSKKQNPFIIRGLAVCNYHK